MNEEESLIIISFLTTFLLLVTYLNPIPLSFLMSAFGLTMHMWILHEEV